MNEVQTVDVGSYVPAHLAIEAMRDNGYKNTAYAVAELIDNSIQADATMIELLCADREDFVAHRRTKRLVKIAVLDNGSGMTADVLKIALQFGNGTRLDRGSRTGIGRFGMGLPASSISQCTRVDVWSWKDGVDSAIHTYLDVDEIRKGLRSTVPDPQNEPIPDLWLRGGTEFGETGTLVVWSQLDRLLWSKATTVLDNSEFLFGRMYRKFLDSGDVKIRMAAFDLKAPTDPYVDKYALPNDPGYLMKNTNCPAPFNTTSMFKPLDDSQPETSFIVKFAGEEHEIVVRPSIAKDAARQGDLAGSTPHGKHAAKNVGISIVRAGRELELDQSQVLQYDPRERWWGIEVEFPPSLDELMGVTNNKQSARNFADVLSMDIESLVKPGKTLHQIMDELAEEGDPRAPLVDVANFIRKQLNAMREMIRQQKRGTGTEKRHNLDPETKATELTNQRKQQGFSGTSDKDENDPEDKKEEQITKELVDSGVDQEEAKQLAAQTVKNNLKYLFAEASLETDAFFTVRPRGGTINIILNTKHPAFENLVEVLEDDDEREDNKDDLGQRLNRASTGLKLLLMAWARYEDELPDGDMKERAQDSRSDWGRVARNFLRAYK